LRAPESPILAESPQKPAPRPRKAGKLFWQFSRFHFLGYPILRALRGAGAGRAGENPQTEFEQPSLSRIRLEAIKSAAEAAAARRWSARQAKSRRVRARVGNGFKRCPPTMNGG